MKEVGHDGICNTDLEIMAGYLDFEGCLGHELIVTVEQDHFALSHPDAISFDLSVKPEKNAVMDRVILFISLICLCPLQMISSQEEGPLPMQRSALLFDLSQSSLSWEAGGFGLGLGYERALNARFSLMVGGIYMDLPVDPTSPRVLLASLGLRFYFAPPAIKGFYSGIYPMAGYGIVDGDGSFLAGLMAELGYAWRVGSTRRFILEPYIKYPYIFGQEPLIGIAPGLTLGCSF